MEEDNVMMLQSFAVLVFGLFISFEGYRQSDAYLNNGTTEANQNRLIYMLVGFFLSIFANFMFYKDSQINSPLQAIYSVFLILGIMISACPIVYEIVAKSYEVEETF